MEHNAVLELVSYDTEKYPFAEVIAEDIYGVADLSRFHEAYLSMKRARGQGEDLSLQDNRAARELMKTMDEDNRFYEVFREFSDEIFGPPLFSQKAKVVKPVFRMHMANSGSISGWHRDVDVTGYGRMLTAWIPFVETADSNTIWVETAYGKKDYTPIPVRYGQILFFDSAWLWHGSIVNETGRTRVSMDVRLMRPKTVEGDIDHDIFGARPDWCVDANANVGKDEAVENGGAMSSMTEMTQGDMT